MVSTVAVTSEKMDDSGVNLDEFQGLLLSVPIESTKYSFISMFIGRVLNLANDLDILDPAAVLRVAGKPPVEILPQIAVPSDLWLRGDVAIRAAKVKTAILKDVNLMLQQYLDALQSESFFLIDDDNIRMFEKRIADYNFLDFTLPQLHPNFEPFSEHEELELENGETPKDPLRPESELLFPSKPASAPAPNRLSAISRDIMGKRKLSFLGHYPQSKPGSQPAGSPMSPTDDDKSASSPILPLAPAFNKFPASSSPKSSPVNGLLFKSKIYNKIKKRRELYSLAYSSTTSLSSANSKSSHRHKSLPYDSPDMNFPSKHTPQASHAQRIENQRDKHEYYLQARAFAENINKLVAFIGKSGSRANLMRILEFVKDSVFKFMVVDVCHMTLARGVRYLMTF